MFFSQSKKVGRFFDQSIFRFAAILLIFWIMWMFVFAETEVDYTKESEETVEIMNLISRARRFPSTVTTIIVKRENGENVLCRFPLDKAWKIGDSVIASKYKSKKGKVKFRCYPTLID